MPNREITCVFSDPIIYYYYVTCCSAKLQFGNFQVQQTLAQRKTRKSRQNHKRRRKLSLSEPREDGIDALLAFLFPLTSSGCCVNLLCLLAQTPFLSRIIWNIENIIIALMASARTKTQTHQLSCQLGNWGHRPMALGLLTCVCCCSALSLPPPPPPPPSTVHHQ